MKGVNPLSKAADKMIRRGLSVSLDKATADRVYADILETLMHDRIYLMARGQVRIGAGKPR